MRASREHAEFGRRVAWLVATGFGAGASPLAPGTFGTLMAIPFYLILRETDPRWYLAIVIVTFTVGVAVCAVVEEDLGVHDHPSIVWDEMVGYWVTMFLAPRGWHWMIIGFGLFRLFDIWKPMPIRAIERVVRGGFGSMLDDLLAGVYAFFALQLVHYASVSGL